MSEHAYPRCCGCGYCCSKTPCALGISEGATTAPCKFLVHRDKKYRCGLVVFARNERERQRIMEWLYIGAGCSSSLNSKRREMIRAQG